MKNLHALKNRYEIESALEKNAARQAEQERAAHNDFTADLIEMEREYRHENAQAAADAIDIIEKNSELISQFEKDTGQAFDVLGPLLTQCHSCCQFYQYKPEHICAADIAVRLMESMYGAGSVFRMRSGTGKTGSGSRAHPDPYASDEAQQRRSGVLQAHRSCMDQDQVPIGTGRRFMMSDDLGSIEPQNRIVVEDRYQEHINPEEMSDHKGRVN